MLYILVEYDGKMVRGEVIGEYAVNVSMEIGPVKAAIRLDQCRNCGVWKDEDNELYGDGFCEQCAEMCFECESYHNIDVMSPIDDGEYDTADEYTAFLCPKCEAKRRAKGDV